MGFLGKIIWTFLFAGAALTLPAFKSLEKIRYFQSRTMVGEPVKVRAYRFDFKDSIPNDSLYQVKSGNNLPLYYFRKVQADICFDGKCRPLDIILYWNVTGRYLGFEMPAGEYLSKTDHEPFVKGEYEHLHQILADDRSALGGLTYNQIVVKPAGLRVDLDGVTSATSAAVLDHVVKGAAYTTYKLWHIIYGPTQREVQRLTAEALSAGMILQILESPDLSDRMWGLQYANGSVKLTPELFQKIVGMVSNENYSLTERALHAIDPSALKSDAMQLSLLNKFKETDYAIKKLIIDKLKDAPYLSKAVKESLANEVLTFNPDILTRVLNAFARHKVSDLNTSKAIARLLRSENAFIAKKAYDFLVNVDSGDAQIKSLIRDYKNQQQ